MAAPTAQAARSQLRPFFSIRAAYNDNVLGIDQEYTQADGQRREPLKAWQFSYAPGLSLMYLTGRVSFEAQYKLGFEDYQRAGDLPEEISKKEFNDLDYISHQGRFRLAREWERFTLSIEDTILASRRLEDLYNNTDRSEASRYVANVLTPAIEIRWNVRHKTLFEYRLDTLSFKDDKDQRNDDSVTRRARDNNSEAHWGFFTHSYQADAVNSIKLQHLFQARSFKKTSDYMANATTLQYERQLPKYNLGTALGYQHTDFERECVDIGGPCEVNPPMRNHNIQMTMIGKFWFRANRGTRLHWEAIGERGRNIYGTNSFYSFNRADTRAVYLFTPKLSTSAAFTLVNNRFDNERLHWDLADIEAGVRNPPPRTRMDWFYRAIATLTYQPKPYFNINLEYDFRKRDSSQAQNDLKNNIVFLEVRFYPGEIEQRQEAQEN